MTRFLDSITHKSRFISKPRTNGPQSSSCGLKSSSIEENPREFVSMLLKIAAVAKNSSDGSVLDSEQCYN